MKKHLKIKNNPELTKANARLVAIKDRVTSVDRKEAPASEAYVVKYLNGKGTDLETALSLLDFFEPRITARVERLEQPLPATA